MLQANDMLLCRIKNASVDPAITNMAMAHPTVNPANMTGDFLAVTKDMMYILSMIPVSIIHLVSYYKI